MKKIRLFCFPYAGGSAAVFNPWRRYLDKSIELVTVELAGRGKRIYDPPYDSIDEAVEDVYKLIGDRLEDGAYSFFGHSMGGIIAYELAYKIREDKLPEPVHIFFAGRGAPHVPDEDNTQYHTLPDEEFKKEVLELGGTPREFFEHPELLEVFLPLLKSDFKIAETYDTVDSERVKPFDYDISVLIGKEEEATAEQVDGWKIHTRGVCSIHYFEGEHFFINEATEKVVQVINTTLMRVMRSGLSHRPNPRGRKI